MLSCWPQRMHGSLCVWDPPALCWSDNALGYAGLPVKSPALPTLVLAQLSTGCPQSSFPIYLHLSKTALSSKVKHFGGI